MKTPVPNTVKQQTIFNENSGVTNVLGELEETREPKIYKSPLTGKKKGKDDGLDLMALFGGGSGYLTSLAAQATIKDEDLKQQTDQLKNLWNTAQLAGGVLSKAAVGMVALQAGLMGMSAVVGIKDDLKKVKDTAKAKKAANADKLAKNTADDAVKATQKAVIGEVTEVAGKNAANAAQIIDKPVANAAKTAVTEGVEAIAKNTADDVAKTATKTAVEAAVKSVSGEAVEIAAKAAVKSSSKLGARAVPILGAFVTAGFAIDETAGFWNEGKKKQAIGAAFAGTAETIFSVGGFLTMALGEASREGIHWVGVKLGGDEMKEVARSDTMELTTAGKTIINEFNKSSDGTADLQSVQVATVSPDITRQNSANQVPATVSRLDLYKAS